MDIRQCNSSRRTDLGGFQYCGQARRNHIGNEEIVKTLCSEQESSQTVV